METSETKSPEYSSDLKVELVKASASDNDVIYSARVSTLGEQSLGEVGADPQMSKGLINFLMKNRHGTPFEHNSMTFFVQAPIFVFREFHRHRIGFSYNEESGRYKELEPLFYLPGESRKLQQVGKPGHYEFIEGSDDQKALVREASINAYENSYEQYRKMLEAGIAKEVARIVLPVGIYSSMYVTCNSRSLMSFLSLRTKDPESTFPSYPLEEIDIVARKLELDWAKLMPITHKCFDENGRVAP